MIGSPAARRRVHALPPIRRGRLAYAALSACQPAGARRHLHNLRCRANSAPIRRSQFVKTHIAKQRTVFYNVFSVRYFDGKC